MDIDLTAARLAALGNATRLRLYRALVRAGDNGLTMGQVQERLGIPASTLSHHCRALVQVGLIRQERAGTSLICRTNYAAMRGLIGDLAAECCADAAPAAEPAAAEAQT
ncbi:ArsR/SmtB family transcription factor [Tabrizicola flagellatus]|uniref:ArsR/SmtB family transcription factor n=1 Tax=Tabrizicola flagellatus TaxID=2593021 RepID=UPI0011F2EF4C|nr:metalloregulator ArsR/SmtB family transcription factor [Tabrizicola flagellatus]